MRNKLFYILLILIFPVFGWSQKDIDLMQGKISFITNSSVYVKFDNMRVIEVGDTLFVSDKSVMNPALIVNRKSSTSGVCILIDESFSPEVDMSVFYKNVLENKLEDDELLSDEDISSDDTPDDESQNETPIDGLQTRTANKVYDQKIRLRTSFASYSTFRNEGEDRHRTMYRLSGSADHIDGGKWSMETYMNYRVNHEPGITNPDDQNKFFRLYNAALHYDVDTTLRLTVGRKINYRASSLGVIDGLQAEKKLGNYFVGGIAGFRPDFVQFDFNPKLFEYGFFAGREDKLKKFYGSTTLGYLEQMNAGTTDRRYMYVQHSSSVNRKLSLFGSFEMDLFQNIDGNISSEPNITSLFVSTRYRLNRNLRFSVSYDNRKRIIFYETMKTDIERLLEDNEARQGLRFRMNTRFFKLLNVGASYSKRFQADGGNASDNINVYLSVSRIPTVGGRISLNLNQNESNYFKGNIYSARYSRSIIKRKLNMDAYFRNTNYSYSSSENTLTQNYYGLNMTYRVLKGLSLSILGEMSTREGRDNYRVNTRLTKRFNW